MDVIQALLDECDDIADDEPAWIDGWLNEAPFSERLIEVRPTPTRPAVSRPAMDPLEIWRCLRDIDIPEEPIIPKRMNPPSLLPEKPAETSKPKGLLPPLNTFKVELPASFLKKPKKKQPWKYVPESKLPAKPKAAPKEYMPVRGCIHERKRRHCNSCDDIVCSYCGKNFPKLARSKK